MLLADLNVLRVSASDGALREATGDAGSGGIGGAGGTSTVVGDIGLSLATFGNDDTGSFRILSGGGLFFFAGCMVCRSEDGVVTGGSISMFHTVDTKVAISFSEAVEVNR